MDRPTQRDRERRWRLLGRRCTIALVLLLVLTVSFGYAAADNSPHVAQVTGETTYTVEQGGNCLEITPISGNASVKKFYDYREPVAGNPYRNATGKSYSSEGTMDLQRANSSILFLYRDSDGNLSLVMVHGANNNTSGGGSVSFDITGLPDTGQWAVKDDKYRGESNYDNWTSTSDTDHVDWTWGPGKTDGGAYSGLGDTFSITIDPAFNTEAALSGRHYNGTVRKWSVLSDGRGSPKRIGLKRQSVTLSTGTCNEKR